MKKYQIAILMHESDNENTVKRYLIYQFARYWSEDGHTVFYLFGTKKYIQADLIFVHVDLSVVPNAYLTFARRYPVCVNGQVGNIKKSFFSQNLLRPNDPWDGQVIIKTNKNAAGVPERWRGGFTKKIQNKLLSNLKIDHSDLHIFKPPLKDHHFYPIYEHIRHVPRYYFFHPGLVVQKFTPETEKNFYCIRYMRFLGDRFSCKRLKGYHPIVTGETMEKVETSIDPHKEITAMRKKLQFDYGKFDYVVVDGKPILLDINKTMGCPPDISKNKEMNKQLKYLAKGLYSYFRS